MMPLKNMPTLRNFACYEFDDRYGNKCSLQKSSIATEDCVWLGVDEAGPRLEPLNRSARMHLTQAMVEDLLPILQKFVETGEID